MSCPIEMCVYEVKWVSGCLATQEDIRATVCHTPENPNVSWLFSYILCVCVSPSVCVMLN